MRPSILAIFLASLVSAPARADHRVVMVVPPEDADQEGAALDLETRIGHSPDVSLISRGAQLEILKWLKSRASSGKLPKTDDAMAQRLGRLSGADGVLYGSPGAWRLCKLPSNDCSKVAGDAAAASVATLTSLGAAQPDARAASWPDETKNAAAMNAYAACRAKVSFAVEQEAVKGHKTQLKGIDGDCKKALAADPNYMPAQAALAAVRAIQGSDSGEKELREALVALPMDPLPAEALIHLLVEADRPAEALEALAVAETSAKNSIDLRRLRGERLYQMDMFAEALPAFEAALALAPRSPYLHWRLSDVLHRKNDNVEALKHAQAASELSGGEHPFYQEEYASRLLDNGRYPEGQTILEALRKEDPDWGRIALRLGYALHKQGRTKDALPLFEEAAKAKPRSRRENEDRGLAMLDLARADAKLGDADGAFAQLNKLKSEKMLDSFILKETDFDPLRNDARFTALR